MIDRLGTKPAIIAWPIGAEAEFKGIVDIVKMKALVWHEEQLGAKYDEVDVPAEYKDKAEELHTQLVEMAVEQDEKLLEAYLDGKMPTEDQLKACIRKGAVGVRFVPVLCGAAFMLIFAATELINNAKLVSAEHAPVWAALKTSMRSRN